MKEDFGLRPGVVKDQRRLVLLDLLQNRGDRIGRAAACPRRGFVGGQHGDIRVRPGVGMQDVTRVRVAR